MASLLIHAWTLIEKDKQYYLPFTHWIYLKEIVKYFDNVGLLSPVLLDEHENGSDFLPVSMIGNLRVHPLPYARSYIGALPSFLSYLKAYRQLEGYDTIYLRYPVPFGWLSKVYAKKAKRIIHFVGDPVDATMSNPNHTGLKKRFLVSGFMQEYAAYIWACGGAKVFTNGFHLKNRLARYRVEAVALTSSTLRREDFFFDEEKFIDAQSPKLLYVGYLRPSKGVETVLKGFKHVQRQYPSASLTIVGKGEIENQLKGLAGQLNITNGVQFLGHIEDREALNTLYRQHHVFCFASLSEGSPRVVLEAMANGINVVSTPVGALPALFTHHKEILFTPFGDDEALANKVISLLTDKAKSSLLRRQAYEKVQHFTVENFIKEIFDGE